MYWLIKRYIKNNPVRAITSRCSIAIEYLSIFVKKHLYKEVNKVDSCYYYYYYHYYYHYYYYSNQEKVFVSHIYRNRLFRPFKYTPDMLNIIDTINDLMIVVSSLKIKFWLVLILIMLPSINISGLEAVSEILENKNSLSTH